MFVFPSFQRLSEWEPILRDFRIGPQNWTSRFHNSGNFIPILKCEFDPDLDVGYLYEFVVEFSNDIH